MVPLRLTIDDSFYMPEYRNGYLVSSEMKKVWAVELDLLNEFARVCSIYSLKWFAHAGTMLGAVRHHGFIPWDDDIDIMMPREDYNKLCSIGCDSFSYPYFFQNEETDRFFCRNFSRLRNSETTAIQVLEEEYSFPYNQGIFIDIFPYDNLPDDDDVLQSEMSRMESLTILAWHYRNLVYFYQPRIGHGLKKRISHYIKHIWFSCFIIDKGDYRKYLQEHLIIATSHNGEDTKRVGEMIVPPLGRHIWNREWLDKTVYMPFEMIQIPVPADFEACLSTSFGKDWQIPKQCSTLHGDVFFNVDKPYYYFINNGKDV